MTGLHIALMAMCTVLYPAFAGPDETFHVDMAYAYSQGHGPYPPGGRLLARGIEVVYGRLTVPPAPGPYSDTPVTPRGQRPSIDAAGGDRPPQGYPVPNQLVQHPPLYYLIDAGVLQLPGVDRLPYDQQVALLRWVSVLLLAPLPLLAWATARRLVGDGPVALTAAVLPVTMPGLTHIGGMVNNDNLLTVLVATSMLVLARVLSGDLRTRTGALVGLLMGLAMLTKGLALVLPVPVAAVYGVAWLRHRRPPFAALGWAAALTVAVGGWWWVRNLLLFGAVQPNGFGPTWGAVVNGPPKPGQTWLGYPAEFLSRFSSRLWGGIGYPDQPTLPAWLTAGWLAALAAGVLVGVAFGIGGSWGRVAAFTYTLPALALTGLIFYHAGQSYVYNGRLPGIQGRYVYPGLTALAVLFAIGVVRLAGRYARAVPLLVLGAGLLTQAQAWRLLISQWWVPRHTVGDRAGMVRGALDGILRWSPWPTIPTLAPFVAVGLLTLVAAVLAVSAVVRATPLAPIAGPLADATPTDATPTEARTDRTPASHPPDTSSAHEVQARASLSPD
jgi:4-amino-4-deoxy-L-arabinose transferase-like glycosyltransferase